MSTYYNEIDPFAAAWLRELMRTGAIASGEVDERSIELVRPADLRGFEQCHFFAGIGGWSYALRLAGVPDDFRCWTGSCPCQPFSSAGKGDGEADPRDLWPAWFRLLRECRPDLVFGEQVEAAARGGWFDRLSADLEGEEYAVGAVVLGAHSVGAYHIRQRLWFVAESLHAERWAQHGCQEDVRNGTNTRRPETYGQSGACSEIRDMAFTEGERQRQVRADDAWSTEGIGAEGTGVGLTDYRSRHIPVDSPVALITESDILRQLADAHESLASNRELQRSGRLLQSAEDTASGVALGDTNITGSQGRQQRRHRTGEQSSGPSSVAGRLGDADWASPTRQREHGWTAAGESGIWRPDERGTVSGFWDACDWLPCRDGKVRPVESGTFPLAHGVPARVGRLRGYGNAIVPQVAATFIEAYLDAHV